MALFTGFFAGLVFKGFEEVRTSYVLPIHLTSEDIKTLYWTVLKKTLDFNNISADPLNACDEERLAKINESIICIAQVEFEAHFQANA
jgi:hypothetical protein